MLWSDDDDQDEGHRERHDGLWVGLPAMWRGDRFADRYSPSMALGAARNMGALGRFGLLDGIVGLTYCRSAPEQPTSLEIFRILRSVLC